MEKYDAKQYGVPAIQNSYDKKFDHAGNSRSGTRQQNFMRPGSANSRGRKNGSHSPSNSYNPGTNANVQYQQPANLHGSNDFQVNFRQILSNQQPGGHQKKTHSRSGANSSQAMANTQMQSAYGKKIGVAAGTTKHNRNTPSHSLNGMN